MDRMFVDPRITIVPGTTQHCRELSLNLRHGDRAEILAVGMSPGKALLNSFGSSHICEAAIVGGEVAAMWGVCGCFLSNKGIPWLLTSPIVERYRIHLFRGAREFIGRCSEEFSILENYVDASYERAIYFLKCLGFQIGEEIPMGPFNAPFRRFYMSQDMWGPASG